MDRGLGGVKDGLLAFAFMMICVGTVGQAISRGLGLRWCIHDLG